MLFCLFVCLFLDKKYRISLTFLANVPESNLVFPLDLFLNFRICQNNRVTDNLFLTNGYLSQASV